MVSVPGFSPQLDRAAIPALRREAGAQHAPLAHIAERHRTQIKVDLPSQFLPEIMRLTAAAIAAAADRRAGLAADRFDRLADRKNDIGDAGVVAAMRQQIAAAGAAHALDQTAAPQSG